MKSIKIIFGICIIWCINACQTLDLNPLDAGASGNWFSSETEIEMSLKGLYRHDFWTTQFSNIWDDDGQNRNTLAEITAGTVNSNWATAKDYWDIAYRNIARANTILERMDQAVSDGIISTEQARQYAAEALFIRGSMYARLVFFFGDVVYTETTLDLDEAYQLGRTPKSEIIPNIYRDYDEAAEVLPIEYHPNVSARATKGAAYAMKARFALYMGDWEIAAEAAKKCIDLGVYEMHPDYHDLFLPTTANSSEGIFTLPYSVELGQMLSTSMVQARTTRNAGGFASNYPSWELLCAYLCTDGLPIDESPLFNPRNPFENRDPRLAATIVEFGTEHLGFIYDPHPDARQVLNTNTGTMQTNNDNRAVTIHASYNGLVRRKGVDMSWTASNGFRSDPDKIIIRLADVYLIYAEAKIELNEIDQSVRDAINTVRARAYGVTHTNTSAYPAVTASTQTELRKAIRFERRMEFPYEGLRYMDLIRWRLAEKVFNQASYGLLDPPELAARVINQGLWFFPETPSVDEDGLPDFDALFQAGYIKLIVRRAFDPDRQYLWPIPANELIINPNMTQNPNY